MSSRLINHLIQYLYERFYNNPFFWLFRECFFISLDLYCPYHCIVVLIIKFMRAIHPRCKGIITRVLNTPAMTFIHVFHPLL